MATLCFCSLHRHPALSVIRGFMKWPVAADECCSQSLLHAKSDVYEQNRLPHWPAEPAHIHRGFVQHTRRQTFADRLEGGVGLRSHRLLFHATRFPEIKINWLARSLIAYPSFRREDFTRNFRSGNVPSANAWTIWPRTLSISHTSRPPKRV